MKNFKGLAALSIVWAVIGLASAVHSGAQELPMSPVTLQAPAEAVVGANIEVSWQGEVAKTDFISIDPKGAAESHYGTYIYPSRGMPGTLAVPDVPGDYEVRYHSGASGYPVRGVSALRVIDTTATIQIPATVDSGADVEIVWTGPGHARDFISIDPVGSEDRIYGPYVYAKQSPTKIRAPEEAGNYLVRYHLAQSYRVLGQAELTVGAVTASVQVAAQAKAGSPIQIQWQGPDGQGDYLTVATPDSSENEYIEYVYTARGNPGTLTAPEEPGTYEVRYHQGQKGTVLARAGFQALANQATIAGPASVAGGSEFEVTWTGPDNRGDYLTIVAAGSRPQDYGDYSYTKYGSPGTLLAPFETGSYELRYVTGRSSQVLASAAIEVTPGAIPGELKVIAGSEGSTSASSMGAVEVILDASGSMLKRLDGERRIEIAKVALAHLTTQVLPAGTPFALRVFGHREKDSCRTDLEIPVAPLNASAVSSKIGSVQAMNLARTPIAASLNKVRQDLSGVSGPITVVLLTDGEETCDGDPKAAIEALRKAGLDVRVNIVGFAIDELQLKEQFEAWARVGNGQYIDAHDKDDLKKAMSRSLEVPYEVLSGDEVVTTGVVNGAAVSLLPGKYTVRLLGSNPRSLGEVEVMASSETKLSADS